MVGLGGKEGWGFCKVSTTVRLFSSIFFLPLSLLPSFAFPALLSRPSLLRLSSPPSFSFNSPVSVFVSSVFLPLGFQSRWEKGGRVGPEWPSWGGRDRTVGVHLLGALSPLLGRGTRPGPPRKGAWAWSRSVVCAAGQRAFLGSRWRSGVGGGGRERQMQIYIKNK